MGFHQRKQYTRNVQGQIWTQGQGKDTSHWLPSFDDTNEKVIFSLDITFQKSFEVISNGILKTKKASGDDFVWQYEMEKPMSSYLVMLAIGHFSKSEDRSLSGIPLEMYFESSDSAKIETTYRNSARVFDFYENEIGVPFSLENLPPDSGSRFPLCRNGKHNIDYIFTRFVVDAVGNNDRSYLNVNAHELAHQWFGDLITAKSSKDHWLQEGFATYYALLAEREVFGR